MTGLELGTYALRVQAVDIYGNVSMAGPYLLEVRDAPIAGLTATNDGPRMVGQTVTFEATISGGSNVTYTWAFGDGATAAGWRVAHAHRASGIYTATVTASNSASTLEATTLVTIVILSVEAGEDQTADEGDPVSITATFYDDRAGVLHTATLDWGDDTQTAGVVDEAAYTLSGSHVYADDGAYTVIVTVSDGLGHTASDTLNVTVTNVAPTVTASPESQIVQYSEAIAEVTFSATDVAADTMEAAASWSSDGTTFHSGVPAGITLGDGSCSISAGINTCVWKLTGTVTMPEGSYSLRLTVTDKDGGATDKDVTLSVQPEKAIVNFDNGNPVAVQVATAGGTSGAFTLRVCVSERDLPLGNDIGLAQVSMSLVPVGPGGSIVGIADTPTVEAGKQCVTFGYNEVPVNTDTVLATVGGGYYAGTGEDVLVVYDPSLGFTTGGGWVYWPGTANDATGYPGDRTNFGYTMKYNNRKATNIQGSLLLIRHLEDETIYRVKSNALYGLALGQDTTIPMGWASFSGKSTCQEPAWPEPLGNYEFIV